MATPADDLLPLLERELALVVTRLREASATWLAAQPPLAAVSAAPSGEASTTRADVAFALVTALAGLTPVPATADVPRLSDFALADQLAVVGGDVLAAVRHQDDAPTAARALGLVLLHRAVLDGAAPGPHALAAVQAALAPDDELVVALRALAG